MGAEEKAAVTEDFEKAYEAMDKACKLTDEFISGKNAETTKQALATGKHTLAEYYKDKYGCDLFEDSKRFPSYVDIGGQSKGFSFSVAFYTCEPIAYATKMQAFRYAVKCLKEAGITPWEPSLP